MADLISVVIPTYNRSAQLGRCLDALGRLRDPGGGFEVVVVDDGGSAPLEPVLDPYRDSLRLVLERQPNAGPASARNRGAAVARGTLLAFTDDDCQPDPDWLAALARAAAERPGHMIGGRTVNLLPDNPFSAASQHLVSYLYEYALRSADGQAWSGFFASNNLAVPADAFRGLGGFDTGFPLAGGEDRDFCARWNEAGLPAHYAPDATVRHLHRLGPRTFWRQHWNYGRGAFHFHQARARRGDGTLRPEPLRFYTGLLRYPLGREPLPRALLQTSLLAMSQAANALGYFRERWRRPR